ncbi:MAG: choice-of-anchor X domain-containing protein [Myxococcota bacterium]
MNLLLLIATASATPGGVLVRLDAGTRDLDEPVVVRIVPEVGETVDVALLDDGQSPDVTKGDGQWTGVATVEEGPATVEVRAGDRSLGTTPVTLPATEGPRDLDVALKDGAVSARSYLPGEQPQGLSPEGATPPTDPSVGGTPPTDPSVGATSGPSSTDPLATGTPPLGDGVQPPAEGAPPLGDGVLPPVDGASPAGGTPLAGGAPAGGAPRAGGVSFPTGEKRDDGTLWIGLGVGLLVLLGAAWLFMRTRQAPAERPAAVTVVPEPGLLGPGTPSLSDGLSMWIAPEDPALVQAIVSHLADRHRVLVVARSDVQIRPVAGGPVYRLAGTRPSQVGDAAEALAREEGPPLAVLIVSDGADAAALRDYADLLPTDVGGVVLVGKELDAPLARVTLRAGADGTWEIDHKDGTRRLRATDDGFEAV